MCVWVCVWGEAGAAFEGREEVLVTVPFLSAGRVQLVDVDNLRVGGFLPRKSTVVDGGGWVGFLPDGCRRTLWTVP